MQQQYKIESEEPDVHWRFLSPNGKKVLDLGCSKFLSSISTAQWFIEQGATHVVGVDLQHIGYEHPKFTMDVKKIDSLEKMFGIIDAFKPSVIKADVEGAEMYFNGIDTLPYVEEVAIEYHSAHLHNLMKHIIKKWGFKDIDTYQLFDLDPLHQGVLHAKR